MKVLFINSVVDYGSTGKIVRELANSLKDDGHEVLIAYGRNKKEVAEDSFYFGDTMSTLFHVAMTRFFGRHGLHSSRQTRKLIHKIESYKPDVIHLHNVHGYYLNVPMLFEYLSSINVKVLWTLHDAWPISGSSAYFDYHGCKVWNDGCVECNSTDDYPQASLIKRQKKNFKWKKDSFTSINDLTIITPSQWLQKLIETTFLRKYPVVTVHNGINTSVFKSHDSVVKDSKLILGVSNDWEERKGLKDFIKLRELLPKEYSIKLVGLSEKQIASLSDGIYGISRTNSVEELVDLYASAYVFVNPTYEDNYPTTNIESLCCHTPVLAYDTGGNKEVDSEPYVQIVNQGDIQTLSDVILSGSLDVDFSDFDTSKHDTSTFVKNMMQYYNK